MLLRDVLGEAGKASKGRKGGGGGGEGKFNEGWWGQLGLRDDSEGSGFRQTETSQVWGWKTQYRYISSV